MMILINSPLTCQFNLYSTITLTLSIYNSREEYKHEKFRHSICKSFSVPYTIHQSISLHLLACSCDCYLLLMLFFVPRFFRCIIITIIISRFGWFVCLNLVYMRSASVMAIKTKKTTTRQNKWLYIHSLTHSLGSNKLILVVFVVETLLFSTLRRYSPYYTTLNSSRVITYHHKSDSKDSQ